MQLSRPLLILILPLFFARRLLFQRRFFDFLFKPALFFSLSGGFFFVLVFFFCSDVCCGVSFFSFCLFFSLFTLLFFRFGGFHFDNTGERRKEKETNEKIE